jgi:hypothetical protein
MDCTSSVPIPVSKVADGRDIGECDRLPGESVSVSARSDGGGQWQATTNFDYQSIVMVAKSGRSRQDFFSW